jgi:ABC-type sugar transport system, periplasmic component
MKKILIWLVVVAVLVTMALTGVACKTTTTTTAATTAAAAETTAAAATTTAAPAATTAAPAAKVLNITYVPPLIAHPVWLVAKKGFEDAAKDLGFTSQWVGPAANDVNEMVKLIEVAIAAKADGIITYGAAPEALIPVFQKAADAGIPVVTVIGDVPGSQELGFMGTDPENFGMTGAKVLSDKMGSTKIEVVGQMFALDAAQNIANFKGYKDGLAKHAAGFDWLETNASNSDMATGMQKWETAIATYPQVNAFVCSSGESAASAAKVLTEMKLVGKITVIGIDDMKETLDAIRSDVVYATLTQNFYRCGYQAAQWIVDYQKTGAKPSPNKIDTGTIVVTKANVDTYINEMMDKSKW